jgi:hypothetical protein
MDRSGRRGEGIQRAATTNLDGKGREEEERVRLERGGRHRLKGARFNNAASPCKPASARLTIFFGWHPAQKLLVAQLYCCWCCCLGDHPCPPSSWHRRSSWCGTPPFPIKPTELPHAEGEMWHWSVEQIGDRALSGGGKWRGDKCWQQGRAPLWRPGQPWLLGLGATQPASHAGYHPQRLAGAPGLQ